MPRSKLAMVAIVGGFDGPWSHVNGLRKARVEVRGLAAEDSVWLETEGAGHHGIIELQVGPNLVLMESCEKYRACKRGASRVATTVEVFPDG